jgi:uncharacterized coiled-coil protein SlyX
VADRLLDVEIKIAFLERHLAELDDVVRRLVDELATTRRELGEVRDAQSPPEKPSLESEKPPHY